MIVYLIRHGETNLNKQKRLQGGLDIPLNEYGRTLAKLTGAALQTVRFDCAFSSPLSRAMETARIVVGDRKIPIVTEPRIREISFGEYEGLCYRGEGCNIPDKSFANFFESPENYQVPPKGESFQDVIARTGQFWEELTQNTDLQDKTVLVSTHGCALKGILANINHTPIEKFWGRGVHKNCAVTIVEVNHGNATILEEGSVFY